MSNQKRLLITGGAGMVGQNIVLHPLAKNWEILAPTRAELDLTNTASVMDWMHRNKPDAVIHAAGRVGGIQANIANPVDFLVQNIDIARNVIMSAKNVGVPHLLNLASSCMYPRSAPNPLSEDLILKGELEPTNEGYALAKIFSTRLCQYIRLEQSNFLYKTLIPCNLYGLHDKFQPEHSHLIPAIIHKIHQAKIDGKTSVDIWGDGTSRREFMYAGDLAEAILRALENIAEIPDLMNIGLGFDHSINEYYQTIAKVIGWDGQFTHDLTRPVGMKQKLVQIDRQIAWGWTAQTSLIEGICKTYDYYLKEYLK